jgi:hypothetical protein
MTNWKIPVGFAGFGAVVSLLAGIIGGNPFGVILLRLILSAGVCGGLGLVVNLIVNKFLPELSANPPIPQTKSGEEVDIVIDEHIPFAEEAEREQVSEAAELVQRTLGTEPVEATEIEESGSSAGEEEALIDVAEELGESEEDVLTLEDADSEEETTPEEFVPGSAAAQVTDFDDLDTLPDIDLFNPAAEQSAPPSKPSRRSSQVEEVVRNQDPENLARAVRTFMKKDQ